MASRSLLVLLVLASMSQGVVAGDATKELSRADRLDRIAAEFDALGMQSEAAKYRGKADQERARANRLELVSNAVVVCKNMTVQMEKLLATMETAPADDVNENFQKVAKLHQQLGKFLKGDWISPSDSAPPLSGSNATVHSVDLGGESIQHLQRFPDGFQRF